ncbi:MAG: GIY-YIG nuclease family protein [Atopobiaceae bacterium]
MQLSNALSTYTTLALAAALLLSVLYLIFKNRRSLIAHSRMRRLQRGSRTIDVGDFLCQLDTLVHNGDFSGIYVLYNVDKDAYYVGQAHRVLARVKQHFSGHGNGDVYADWKYGDTFTLTMFDLYHSGYMSLDDFERDAIAYYGAYTHGYNKNHGIQRTQR